jgi:hypothetical protein
VRRVHSRITRAPVHSGILFISELPLQHSSAVRRLTGFGALVTVSCALACYQDKPPQAASGAQSASTSTNAGAQLGLQPVPATHDTAIREIDQFQLTQQRLQEWMVAKRSLDSLNMVSPEIERRLRAGTPPKGIDEAGKRFDGEPAMHAVLQHAGMSGKDFLLTSIALQQAMKGFQLKAMGKLDESRVPPVVKGNIIFVASHMQELMGSIAGQQRPRPNP